MKPVLRAMETGETLASQVVIALRDCGWGSVDVADVHVENKSGGGGGRCYKVSAGSGDPSVVALHVANAAAPSDFLARMVDASKVFSDGGVGPRRLAYGENWFIEAWEGAGQPEMSSVEDFRELGKLLAEVHK